MKIIPLTKGAVALVDDADFDALSRWRWKLHPQGYACRSTTVNGRPVTHLMHRVVAQTPAHLQADHINRNRLDNRRANLRNVTGSVNTMNQGLSSRNTSGYRGVTWDAERGKWQAKTKRMGRWIFLGRFASIEEAERARQAHDAAYELERSTP